MGIHREFCAVWFKYYQAQKGHNYRMTGREEAHLRNIRKALIDQLDMPPMDSALILMWNTFLLKIKNPFVLQNLNLGVIDAMFNNLWADHIAGKFPDYYDANFAKKLDPEQTMNYQKHLRSKGWKVEYHPTVGTTYKRPQ